MTNKEIHIVFDIMRDMITHNTSITDAYEMLSKLEK